MGFPGISDNIDVAFVWGGNNKIYFFKGTKYWKFDPVKTPHVRTDRYPRNITSWDLPDDLEGAFQWTNGKTYFFKEGQYWRFNDRLFTVDFASPAFPRPSTEWWFGCPPLTDSLQKDEFISVALNRTKMESNKSDDLFNNLAGVGNEDLDHV